MPRPDHAVLLKIKWERHILNPYRHGMAGARHAMCESAFNMQQAAFFSFSGSLMIMLFDAV
jgi:hypothetical protein